MPWLICNRWTAFGAHQSLWIPTAVISPACCDRCCDIFPKPIHSIHSDFLTLIGPTG
ncbi:hypothetical protein BDV40DRAFT_274695 [Aspergillus tamarii]|uniref:Uncharacterized protein n=1 Tax=Aspergillus tamarii TaxID=41984 RepID=A0A5N6UJU7_ASPTM|nr:hypothetical protein BDV40DRAFT_274695 [Aspergillus tamarii]